MGALGDPEEVGESGTQLGGSTDHESGHLGVQGEQSEGERCVSVCLDNSMVTEEYDPSPESLVSWLRPEHRQLQGFVWQTSQGKLPSPHQTWGQPVFLWRELVASKVSTPHPQPGSYTSALFTQVPPLQAPSPVTQYPPPIVQPALLLPPMYL